MIKYERDKNFIFENLSKLREKFDGRYITKDESMLFKKKLALKNLDKVIIKLMTNVPLVGQYFSLLKKKDLSGLGVEMVWLNAEHIVDETLNYFPGRIVCEYGYVMVGICAYGGYPYGINCNKKGLPIVRVPYDRMPNNIFDSSVIEIVSPTLLTFLEESSVR